VVERIDPETASPGELEEHFERYRFAAEHVLAGETVLDAACGTGYGRAFFEPWARWIGVDRHAGARSIGADLETWTGWRDLAYDVFVGLETLEHLQDDWNYRQTAWHARRKVVISTPVVRTTMWNEYHVRDFTACGVVALFGNDEWELECYREQAWMYGLFAFRRLGT
jgi:hypothetical protein